MDDKLKNLLRMTDEWIDAHKMEFVTELQELTRIPSISRADLAEDGAPFGPECRRVLDYALERGRHYGFETMDHDGYAGSICFGDADNAIGLFTHLDVVPVGEGWIYKPFDAVYLPEHDAIIGRGCDDNKCVTVACLFVMRMLKEFDIKLKHGVRLFCGTSEETGMQDMKALIEGGFEFPKLSFVPDAGFPVNYGQKGSVSGNISIPCEGNLVSFDGGSARNVVPDYAECVIDVHLDEAKRANFETEGISIEACGSGTKITAAGNSAHAASPESGINAINRLTVALVTSGLLTGSCADAISQLHELTSDFTGGNENIACSDDMSGALTIVYGAAHLKNGVLSVLSDCRAPITCNAEKLSEKLKDEWKRRGFTVDGCEFSEPYYIPKDDRRVEALQKLFYDITGLDSQPFVMGGGNYARVIPNAISFGPGMPTEKKISDFLPSGHGGCHGRDEAVVMGKVYNCARIYIAAIVMMDEMM